MRLLSNLCLFALAALLLAAGCKKDKVTPAEQLPPATTSGANTFGCLVNGEVWKAEGASHMRADWTVPDGLSATMGFRQGQGYCNLNFTFADTTRRYALRAGTYSLASRSGVTRLNYASVSTPTHDYHQDTLISGTVVLTRLNRQAGVMAGTFSFVMASGPGDTIRVTDGRFDIGNMDR